MDIYFNTKQISQMTGVGEEQVRRWIRKGELKGSKDCKKHGHRVLESDLNDFLADHPKYRDRALNYDGRTTYSISPKRKTKQDLDLTIKSINETVKAINELETELMNLKKELDILHMHKTFYEEILVKLEES